MKYSTVTGWAAVCLGLLVWAGPAHAVNRIFLGDDVVKAGETGLTIDVRIDNDIKVYAISLAITYDPSLISISNIEPAGVAVDADWNSGTDLNQINNTAGELQYGILTDLSPRGTPAEPDKLIEPGTNQLVARITYDTKNTDLVTTRLRLETFGETQISGGHINALVDDSGTTFRRGSVNTLNLTDGTLTIDPQKPIIDTTGSQNGQEGTIFQIVGRNFDKGGLAVEVNNRAASFTLRPDNTTLEITAPVCPTCSNNQVECVDIEVTNVNGSDVLTDGFCYVPPPVPIISGFQNAGTEQSPGNRGDTFFVKGENFRGVADENRITSLTMCSIALPANQYLVLSDTTIQVTVPDCANAGWAPMRLCNPHGCTTVAEAFYIDPVGPVPTISGASNNTGVAGQTFFVTGTNFNTPGIRAEVCGKAATIVNVLNAGNMQVMAPDCDAVGWSLLSICNENGCANLAEGFFYDEVTPPEGQFIRGDINLDNALDISDAVALLGDLFLGDTSDACRDALDVNDDGQTDISDAISFLAAQFLGTFVIPPPSPRKGVDPTPDSLPVCPPSP